MRMYTVKSLYNRQYKTLPFTGIWQKVIGTPEDRGCWLIWGAEKNGKTWLALKLAEYLSTFRKVLYVSAEEGLAKTFTDSLKRAQVNTANGKLRFVEYTPLDKLNTTLSKRQSPRIVFFDNITVYADELKYGKLQLILRQHPNKLFIFLAHEENKQPYTSTAKVARKLAQVIMHVEGLASRVSGRCPGGIIYIDEQKAKLYWGDDNQPTENKTDNNLKP